MQICTSPQTDNDASIHTHNLGELVREGTIFGIICCKMKITQADTPTIRMDCHPSRLTGTPISAISTIFMPDALPGTTLPIYPGLGEAPNMQACIPGGLVPAYNTKQETQLKLAVADRTKPEVEIWRRPKKSTI